MLKSSLCNYRDAYIVKETITILNTGRAGAPNNRNKEVVFKNCAPFTNQSALNNDGNIIDFPVNDDTSLSFKY